MKRKAQLFAVMLGLGVAGGAWASDKPVGAVGPNWARAVHTDKTVGPNWARAVHTDKTVGPNWARAVHTDKTVGQESKPAAQGPVLDLNAGF